MENKYSRAKIYKIVCNVTGLVYIGSTCEPTLARRLAGHRRSYKNHLNGKHNYVTSIKVLENENYYIELVKECSCKTKDQLLQFEGACVRDTECVNKNIPGRTRKQYRDDNKDKLIADAKQYYDENKAKQAIKFDCICGGKYTASHKTRHIKSERHKKYLIDT
jgi:hypothetical protein